MTAPSARGARIGIVSAWASRLGGGVFEAVVGHVGLVRALGHEPVVIALEDAHSAADRTRFAADVEVVTCPVRGPGAVGFAPALVPALAAARLDLLHLHGIWMYPSHAAARWAAATRRPYVISPHGMLDPWITARGRAKKALARIGYERRSWRRASLFHALTQDEASDIAAEAGAGAPVTVVPNPVAPAAPRACAVPPGPPVVVSIGRIHPKKNLDGLIAGWDAAADRLAPLGARLRIAGWGEPEDVAALERRLTARGRDDVVFLGPVFGAAKAALLAEARYLALPSFSEGLPIAILEAWSAGVPTLMSRHCHLSEGFAAGAAVDCGTDAETIAAALALELEAGADAWAVRSRAAAALAAARFSPDVVAERWRGVYARLLRGDAGQTEGR